MPMGVVMDSIGGLLKRNPDLTEGRILAAFIDGPGYVSRAVQTIQASQPQGTVGSILLTG